MKINILFQFLLLSSAVTISLARTAELSKSAHPFHIPKWFNLCFTPAGVKYVVERPCILGTYPIPYSFDMSSSTENNSSRYPCGVCEEEVEDFGARAVACNSCDRWIHKSCVGMLTAEYDQLAETSQPWLCPECGTAHHSTVIYDIPVSDVSDQSSSQFSISSEEELSSPQLSRIQHSSVSSLNDSSINSIGSPGAASSPNPQKQSPKQRKRSLRILVINFQRIRKKGKNIDVLIETI